jgi:hypothetical protein
MEYTQSYNNKAVSVIIVEYTYHLVITAESGKKSGGELALFAIVI